MSVDLDELEQIQAKAGTGLGTDLAYSVALRNAAPALIALAREAVALRERMDAAREVVEKAGIVLPVGLLAFEEDAPDDLSDAEGKWIGEFSDDLHVAAIIAALNLLHTEKTDGPDQTSA